MLAIKLKRIGKKHQPAFRVVVDEKRSKVKGDFVEDLGWLNPLSHDSELKSDRIKYWLSVGAQPTVTVHNLLVKKGILEASKIAIKIKVSKKEGEAEVPAAQTSPAAEAQPE